MAALWWALLAKMRWMQKLLQILVGCKLSLQVCSECKNLFTKIKAKCTIYLLTSTLTRVQRLILLFSGGSTRGVQQRLVPQVDIKCVNILGIDNNRGLGWGATTFMLLRFRGNYQRHNLAEDSKSFCLFQGMAWYAHESQRRGPILRWRPHNLRWRWPRLKWITRMLMKITLNDLTIDKIDMQKIKNNLVWLWAYIIRTPFTGFSISRNKDS